MVLVLPGIFRSVNYKIVIILRVQCHHLTFLKTYVQIRSHNSPNSLYILNINYLILEEYNMYNSLAF